MLEASREGSLLREGLQVVLVGQPNVGKSSLLNRFAGEELAIVTPLAGTTRDAIRLSVDLAGVPVHFIDTAGLRASDDPVERLGIARTWRVVQQADCAVLMMDAGAGETSADRGSSGEATRERSLYAGLQQDRSDEPRSGCRAGARYDDSMALRTYGGRSGWVSERASRAWRVGEAEAKASSLRGTAIPGSGHGAHAPRSGDRRDRRSSNCWPKSCGLTRKP